MSNNDCNIEKYDFSSFEHERLPYTMVPNHVIQKTPSSNIKAAFLWVFFQSLPSTWNLNKSHIMAHFKISSTTYERWMAWLNKVNLIEYRQQRNKNGSFGECKLIVLNGSRFDPLAEDNRSVKIDDSDVNRSVILPGSGETGATANDVHINTTLLEIKEKDIYIAQSSKHSIGNSTENQDHPHDPSLQISIENTQGTIGNLLTVVENNEEAVQSFELFWNIYPIKKLKKRAFAAWLCQNCHEISKEIIEKLKQQIAFDSCFLTGFAPSPSNYIFQERWEDEIQHSKEFLDKQKKKEEAATAKHAFETRINAQEQAFKGQSFSTNENIIQNTIPSNKTNNAKSARELLNKLYSGFEGSTRCDT